MKRHANISIFIPHNGCPHQCSFCNQKSITGRQHQPTFEEVDLLLRESVKNSGVSPENTEIAFFGGSFTAIDRRYMLSLLKAAKPYTDYFKGIRISTRPDYIDDEVLTVLKEYNVTSIELGAQSADDGVLLANERGHSLRDIENASYLIKKHGFSLGLQMMTGLYRSDEEKDIFTAKKFIELAPQTVRIYPTVIMKDTSLARLYLSGEFVPYSLSRSVELCAKLIMMFESSGINIIRLGLHYSDSLVKDSLCDNYHPAFKELCESRIFYNAFLSGAAEKSVKNGFSVFINEKSVSKFIGQRRANLKKFEQLGYKFDIKFDNSLGKYDLYIK